jgi:ergothioneine biosynthesis protein EgtB
MSTRTELLASYRRVRQRSLSVCAPLSAEDAQVQSIPDVSPAKWHLAHTTWFFETFVLARFGEPPLDPAFGFLFNSYYESVGAHVDRARRGQLSRPPLQVIHAYRHAVDMRIEELLGDDAETLAIVEVGLQHEQQHQELMLTDIKHVLGTQPMRPAYRPDLARSDSRSIEASDWVDFAGGIVELGAGDGFAFDCERPRHRTLLAPYRLATRPACNAEVLAFIGEGGYREPRFWLSDGWTIARNEGWQAPLYWEQREGEWLQYTLAGVREVDPAETACHLSFYEADALARWAGARLPTEAEWEHAASAVPVAGNFADDDSLQPSAAPRGQGLRHTRGFVRSPARSVSTTASSWRTSSCCVVVRV